MRQVSLSRALKLYGATNIEIHKGYNYRSGFFEKGGQLYYFATKDFRCGNIDNLLIRTAKDRKDYIGGTNTFPFKYFLECNDLTIKITKLKCDFNYYN